MSGLTGNHHVQQPSPINGSKASVGAAGLCRETAANLDLGKILRSYAESFAVMCRERWAVKAPAALHQYTGRSDRTCRAWAAFDNEAPVSVLWALLRSPEGGDVLAYIMRDDPPAWWRQHQILIELGALATRIGAEISAITDRRE